MAAWFFSIAEEKQSSQSKKFEIMENRNQAKCGNQIQILDSKVYLSKEKLQERKTGPGSTCGNYVDAKRN